MKQHPGSVKTYSIDIKGIVQGVGFRPFIWLAFNKKNIPGTVTNTTEGVYIEANFAGPEQLEKIVRFIRKNKPLPSLIESINYSEIAHKCFDGFKILGSLKTEEKFQLISPDLATCTLCMDDISDRKNSRRFQYPFTNCTNCGPRFTIIKSMPYDRKNTTMAEFQMCDDCLSEYKNPSDRRFHAQPNACSKCGPQLELKYSSGTAVTDRNPARHAAFLLKKGKIIGLKSLGGFQIACSALSDSTIKRLRKRKNRPSKPFAVMFKDINAAEKYLKINPAGKNSLLSPAAPIVLLEKKPDARLSEHVSYNNRYEGAMLAYTPLHHLIFEFLDIPLVMTSGNISEEPIASENQEAFDRLEKICDCFLVHNRDIYSKYDDSVIKIFNGREMMLRRARGYAPYPVKLDIDTGKKVVLATGAQEKNTFCIVKKNYAIVSQHTGDLDTIKTADFFRETIGRYRDLFGIKTITAAAYDLHPDYYSSKFAMGNFKNIRKVSVQHHIAHLAGVIAENSLLSKDKIFLGFSWDGSGFGSDGKIWGGETFFIDCSLNFTRVGSLNEKVLPGGSAAVLNPYKMAGVYIYSHFKNISESHINRMALSGSKSKDSDFKNFLFKYFPHYKKIFRQNELEMLTSQIISGYNSPLTTSMGRFFDAVSSLINVTHSVSYEGEAAIDLEMIADPGEKNSYKIKIDDTVFQPGSRQSEKKPQENYFIIDDHYIFSQIIDDFIKKTGIPAISAKFHNTLAQIILDICLYFKKHYNVWSIILSGGVFQNNVLISKAFKILEKNGFKVYTNFAVPVNDGGISLGQAYIAACEIARRN